MPALISLPPRAYELLRYAVASAAGFGVDVLTLWLLTTLSPIPYPVAVGCGFVIGGLVVYVLAIRHVFSYRRVANAGVEASAFVLLGLVGLVINVAVVTLCVESLFANLIVSKMIASTITFLVNYLLRRKVLFSPGNVTR